MKKVVLLCTLCFCNMPAIIFGEEGEVISEETPTENPTENPAPTEAPTNSPSSVSWKDESPSSGVTTTIDDYSGNWFVKKQLLGEARKKFTEIRSTEEKISKQKDTFLAQRTSLNGTLNDFYVNFNFDLDSIDQVLDGIAARVQDMQKRDPLLSAEERKDLETLTTQRTSLEELKKSLVAIGKLDKSLEEAMALFFKQEELARSYEQGAWENYEKMEKILSDDKAEELFWQIQSALENLQAIDKYASQDFSDYMQKTTTAINDAINKVKTNLEQLKQQGLVLQEEIDAQIKQKQQPQPTPPPAPVKKSWFESTIDTVSSWFGFGTTPKKTKPAPVVAKAITEQPQQPVSPKVSAPEQAAVHMQTDQQPK